MTNHTVECWLILQMMIEVLLCGIIAFYIYRERTTKVGVEKDQEKIKTLVDVLQRFVAKSEDLDKKHQRLRHLWEKIEKRGEAVERSIEHYEKTLGSFPEKGKAENGFDRIEPGVASYERTSRLIDKGLPAQEIAQTVGLPKGEVELIMNLKRQ